VIALRREETGVLVMELWENFFGPRTLSQPFRRCMILRVATEFTLLLAVLLRRNHQIYRGTLHYGASAGWVLAYYLAWSQCITGLLRDGSHCEFRRRDRCGRGGLSQPFYVRHDYRLWP
jgi:hypothetical protein